MTTILHPSLYLRPLQLLPSRSGSTLHPHLNWGCPWDWPWTTQYGGSDSMLAPGPTPNRHCVLLCLLSEPSSATRRSSSWPAGGQELRLIPGSPMHVSVPSRAAYPTAADHGRGQRSACELVESWTIINRRFKPTSFGVVGYVAIINLQKCQRTLAVHNCHFHTASQKSHRFRFAITTSCVRKLRRREWMWFTLHTTGKSGIWSQPIWYTPAFLLLLHCPLGFLSDSKTLPSCLRLASCPVLSLGILSVSRTGKTRPCPLAKPPEPEYGH